MGIGVCSVLLLVDMHLGNKKREPRVKIDTGIDDRSGKGVFGVAVIYNTSIEQVLLGMMMMNKYILLLLQQVSLYLLNVYGESLNLFAL